MNLRRSALFGLVILLAASISSADTPSPQEQEILDRGPVDQTAYVAGGIVGTALGFGIGNAIQGRYLPDGLIFTVGELGMAALFTVGAVNCTINTVNSFGTNNSGGCTSSSGAELAIGGLGYLGLRIWEIVDVWATPLSINSRYHQVYDRVRNHKTTSTFGILPATSPVQNGIDGATMAFQLRF